MTEKQVWFTMVPLKAVSDQLWIMYIWGFGFENCFYSVVVSEHEWFLDLETIEKLTELNTFQKNDIIFHNIDHMKVLMVPL